MARTPERTTADLSQYPNLVVIYLGMRVNSLRGLKTLASFGPKIRAAVAARPDGLLLHEDLLFSFLPPHAAMRQYWRDFESLERLGAVAASQGVVAVVPAGQRRHRLLARDVLPRWSSRIHLHRHAACGVCQVRHCETGTRLNVLRTPTSRSPRGCGTATGYSGGFALSILTPPPCDESVAWRVRGAAPSS
jgi:fumigallin biosynthesis monooxygenase-like protein